MAVRDAALEVDEIAKSRTRSTRVARIKAGRFEEPSLVSEKRVPPRVLAGIELHHARAENELKARRALGGGGVACVGRRWRRVVSLSVRWRRSPRIRSRRVRPRPFCMKAAA